MIDVVKNILTQKEREITTYPVRANYASQMGHPCLRFLVYNRLNWQERKPISLRMKLIFDEGRNQEKQILRDMRDAGIEVVQEQQPFTWEKYCISGRIDGIIKNNGNKIPFEIKSMSPFAFNAINSEGDMYSGRWYYRNYLAQLTLYLLMVESEIGLFILKNKSTGEIKQIEYPLVYEFGEHLLNKAKKVNEYVEKKEYPERIEYRADVCNECAFFLSCLPSKLMEETEVVIDEELNLLLEQRSILKPKISECAKIEKQIKARIGERKKVVCGDWVLEKITKTRKGYVVKDGECEVLTYTNLKGGNNG